MILIISTTNRYDFTLGLYKKDLSLFEFETKDQSGDLLPAIEGVLKDNKIVLKDILAILVNTGPGSFTGVRVGITVANVLAWSLNITVIGYLDGKLDNAILKLKIPNSKFENIVLPSYVSG